MTLRTPAAHRRYLLHVGGRIARQLALLGCVALTVAGLRALDHDAGSAIPAGPDQRPDGATEAPPTARLEPVAVL